MHKLYGWNTIGAVSGVLLAEFIFIKYFGIIGTAAVAGVFNLLVVLIMSRSFESIHIKISDKEPVKVKNNINRYLITAFFAGMLLLALEIIWFRYLLVAQEGSSIIFAIMLSVALSGIGLGGLVISRFKIQPEYARKLAFIILILASIVTFAGFYLFQWYFDVFVKEIHQNISYFILGVSILILPTCVMSGMVFPLLGECIYRNNLVSTSSTGYLTLANTMGAFIGSAIASFYLLPVIGIEYSIFIIILSYLLISVLLAENIKRQVIAVSVVMICMVIIFPHGMVKKSYQRIYSEAFPKDKNLLFFREGLNQTIAYLERKKFGQRSSVRLVTNNYSMSSTAPIAQRYMRLYTYFPYLLSNKIESVLQISYGVGNTAESVIMLPDMKHFDVVDMSPDILELSHILHDGTGVYPLKDKRTSAHVEDGRFFLQTTQNKYDLITAEPPPPMMAGVVNLYTQEYFQLIYDALKPGGISTYWLPLHAFDDINALAVIKAFCNVFKTCSLWNGAQLEFMLVGSKSRISQVNNRQLTEKWSPVITSEFIKMGFDNPGQVFATFVGDYEYLGMLTENIGPVTDNYPQRITPYSVDAPSRSVLYSDFFNIKRRVAHFTNSQYVQSLFDSKLINSITKEFKREGIITSSLISGYEDVLLGEGYTLWDAIVEYIPNKNRSYVSLGLFATSYLDIKLMDKVFESDDIDEAYRFEYIKYLFLDNKFSLLEIEVKKILNDSSIKKMHKYYTYRYYLLSKIIQKTVTIEDISLSKELSENIPDHQGFEDWYMKNI